MKKALISIMAILCFAPVAQALNVVFSGAAVTETSKASTQTYTIDINASGGDVIGAQLAYASATIPSLSLTDGSVSTGTITVTTTTLLGVRASDTITVSTTAGLTGAAISLNGLYVYNRGWRTDASSNTAIDIATGIDALSGYVASTSAATTVTVTCANIGAFCNGQTLAVVGTSSITVSSPTFQGGRDAATIMINGYSKSAGVDFSTASTTALTATNLAAAINADAFLSTVLVATAPFNSSVVFTTTTAVGTAKNYATLSSSQAALTLSPYTSSSPVTGIAQGTMFGGTNSAYSLTTPTIITSASHGLTTGAGVYLSTGSNVTIAPLVWGTTYYVIRVDANNLSLATSLANALAGTAITFTSSATKTTADTFTLNTQSLTGTPLFALQASDDGTNYGAVSLGQYGATISAISFASPYTAGSALWDLGEFHHRYLRLAFAGPTTGYVAFTFTLNQKNNKSF